VETDDTQIARAMKTTASASDEVLGKALAYFGPLGPAHAVGARRLLALARLAVAEARLGRPVEFGADRTAAVVVTAADVDAAASILGLSLRPPAAAVAAGSQAPGPPLQPGEATLATPDLGAESAGRRADGYVDPVVQPAAPPVVVPFESNGLAALALDPYPEDSAAVDRDATPLVAPVVQRRPGVRADRGVVVGSMQAYDVRDLALMATLLEAAKYGAVRPRRRGGGITVTARDLRRHRRAAPVERILGLVIDCTSLDDWDWGAAVLPYLREAYAHRAAICIVKLGHADAANELRAESTVARSLLAAPLDDLFDVRKGRATPLAHGLELAFETLRHALQHGRGIAARADLVVVTDGRGNVPLATSHDGVISTKIRDEGLTDALRIGEKIRALDWLDTLLIHGAPDIAAHLTVRLAAALGARRREAEG
jgi:magnesium chelatase subunit D